MAVGRGTDCSRSIACRCRWLVGVRCRLAKGPHPPRHRTGPGDAKRARGQESDCGTVGGASHLSALTFRLFWPCPVLPLSTYNRQFSSSLPLAIIATTYSLRTPPPAPCDASLADRRSPQPYLRWAVGRQACLLLSERAAAVDDVVLVAPGMLVAPRCTAPPVSFVGCATRSSSCSYAGRVDCCTRPRRRTIRSGCGR